MITGHFRAAGAAAICLVCLTSTGCIVVSDNSHDPQTPTLGRELRDLKAARDHGAIEQEQYLEARHKLLARLDKPRGA